MLVPISCTRKFCGLNPPRVRARLCASTLMERIRSRRNSPSVKPAFTVADLAQRYLETGCRCSEITTLRWEDVDLEANEIRLRDSKTGPRVVPLSPGAARVLAGLPRDAGNPWVIAGRKPGSRLAHIVYYWYRVRERAGLDDVRIHDLRHSPSPVARPCARREPVDDEGVEEPTVGSG